MPQHPNTPAKARLCKPLRATVSGQKGAMFGLDARIALAIFAALSVIAGYLGISKLETAHKAAFLKEIMAYEDAITQMQTDFGVFYEFAIDNSDGVHDFNAIETSTDNVKSNFLTKWHGPYIEGIRQDHPQYGSFTLTYGQDDYTSACTYNTTCYVWINLTNVPDELWQWVNKVVDEQNGSAPETNPSTEGRIQADVTTGTRTLYYRTNAKRTP